MATLGNVIDPNKQTSLRNELAQGANVGDMARDASGTLYRWSGVGWDREGGSGISGGGSIDDIINRSIERYQEANKPAVQSLEAGIPETQAKYAQLTTQAEARKDPLIARYENLINEVKNYGQIQEQRQTKVTSAELAKRGLLPSSTLAQQEITDAVNPITSTTSNQVTGLGLERETAIKDLEDYIANLGPKETEELRLARNAIAQLQSGAANQGITMGVDLYKQSVAEQQAAQAAQEDARYKAALLASQNFQNSLAERELNEYKIPSLTKSSSSSSGLDLSALLNSFNILPSTSTKPTTKPKTTSIGSYGGSPYA